MASVPGAESAEGPPGKPAVKIGDERRLALVRAAYQIIAVEGFDRLRTRDVADKVGVNIATLHYYFATKNALIEAVAAYLAVQFQTVRAPVPLEPDPSALARLRREFADSRFYLDERPDMIAVMQELALRARRDPSVARILQPLRDGWRASVEATIVYGLREGAFNAAGGARAASAAIVSALWGVGTFPLDPEDREQVYAAIERWLVAPEKSSK
jgi:AcrR family transcriptional regulator